MWAHEPYAHHMVILEFATNKAACCWLFQLQIARVDEAITELGLTSVENTKIGRWRRWQGCFVTAAQHSVPEGWEGPVGITACKVCKICCWLRKPVQAFFCEAFLAVQALTGCILHPSLYLIPSAIAAVCLLRQPCMLVSSALCCNC